MKAHSKKINLKLKLRNREQVIGSWVTLAHASIPEIMGLAGFDFLVVDMEHSTLDLSETQRLVQVTQSQGLPALVRLGEHNPNLIKRVMDTGADGIIAALVKTGDEAQAIVDSVKYPPEGKRGVGLARAQKYGQGFAGYKKWLKDKSIVMVLIEHIEAIENLEQILEVEGVDGSLIGPYDLSGSLGFPGEFSKLEVKRAIARYERVCGTLKKPMGFHVVHPDFVEIKKYLNRGYSFLAVGLDTLYLGQGCNEVMKKIRRRS